MRDNWLKGWTGKVSLELAANVPRRFRDGEAGFVKKPGSTANWIRQNLPIAFLEERLKNFGQSEKARLWFTDGQSWPVVSM